MRLLRPATDADRSLILELEEAGMRTYAEALWGNWRPSAQPDRLDLKGHEMIIQEGQPVGCIAAEWHPDHLRIAKLYVAIAFRNQGLGATALRRKIQEAKSRALPLRLSVLSTNPDARRFYEREGFRLLEDSDQRHLMEHPAAGQPDLSHPPSD